MTPTLTEADRVAFDRWWGASKYTQVVYAAHAYQACMDGYAAGLAAGMEREREACANLCDNMVLYTGYDCAAAIREQAKGG